MNHPLAALEDSAIRRFKRVEYERMVDLGFFEAERIELLGGLLIAREPQGTYHSEAISRLSACFTIALQGRAVVRSQLPFALGDDSEPEPDLALVPPGSYQGAHPTTALLIVEVADTSLLKDEKIKGALYASGAIDEYWIVDVRAQCILRFRDADRRQWQRWDRIERGTISPVAFPDVAVSLDALFGD